MHSKVHGMEGIRMELISNAKFGQPVESGSVFDVKGNNLGISIHKIHGLDGWFLNCRKIIEIQKDVDLFCADIEVEIKR